MKNKIVRNGLITLALAGILIGSSLIEKSNNQKRKRDYQKFSALYQTTLTTQEIAGKNGASGEAGQELLDSLGIKYALKENERVMLNTGSNAVYVNIRSPSRENGVTRGFANKESLDRYITNHQ